MVKNAHLNFLFCLTNISKPKDSLITRIENKKNGEKITFEELKPVYFLKMFASKILDYQIYCRISQLLD